MNRTVPPRRRRVPLLAWIAFTLSAFVLSFAIENLWIDPWLQHKSHRIPTLVPAQQSGEWFLAFVIAAMVGVLILICLILLVKDREAPVWSKLGVGLALFAICFLGTEWFLVTNGRTGLVQLIFKSHRVVLTWKASGSPVVGYNVYRRAVTGGSFVKLNIACIPDLTYIDDSVKSGLTYEYLTRAVDAQGRESADSNTQRLTVP